jgi:hypothetical protein
MAGVEGAGYRLLKRGKRRRVMGECRGVMRLFSFLPVQEEEEGGQLSRAGGLGQPGGQGLVGGRGKIGQLEKKEREGRGWAKKAESDGGNSFPNKI